jgi:RnfABCDGE-type electron transport complex B subunit
MTGIIIVLAVGIMLVLALCIALTLGWANKALAVEVDPRVESVTAALPGANCGGCGFVGCGEYAEAIVLHNAAPNLCPVGGAAVAQAVAGILGITLDESCPYRPAVHCAATREQKLGRHEYRGEQTCASANLVSGVMGCTFGCLSLGDCVKSCKFDAIHLVNGKIEIDYEKCVGCGACAKACPRKVISMVPFKAEQMFVVACSNKDFGKDVRAVCQVGCIGCKACTRVSNGLFEVKDNRAFIDYDKYDPAVIEEIMKTVLAKCPMGGIVKIGKPSAKDLQAVKDEKMPDVVQAKFETTVDKTEWHG